MMHIDNGFDDLSVSDRKKQRQLLLSEKVDAYFAWVKLKHAPVTHNSIIGKALSYSIHQEYYLRVFLFDVHIYFFISAQSMLLCRDFCCMVPMIDYQLRFHDQFYKFSKIIAANRYKIMLQFYQV